MSEEKELDESPKTRQSSNLAAEYYVASLLFRLGYVATVTFGNTKEIDLIVLDPETKKTVTLDVKGLKNTTNWIMPRNLLENPNHFYVLVTFKNKISDLNEIPEVYTLPSKQVKKIWVGWIGRDEVKAIKYSDLREHSEFKGKDGMKLLFQS
jgi:hypothetical protein